MAKTPTKRQLEKRAAARYSKAGRKRRKAEHWDAITPNTRRAPTKKTARKQFPKGPAVLEDCGGRGCRVPRGKLSVNTFPGYNYTTPSADKARGVARKNASAPCPTVSKPGCRSQLVFIDGASYLRICRKRNKPGYIIPVKSAREANKLGAELCKCTQRNGGNVDACVERVEPGAELGGLGRARRRRRRR